MKSLIRSLLLLSCFCWISATAFAQDDFDKLKSEFQQKATTALGADPIQTWDSLSLYASRKLISRATSVEFNKSEVIIAATFPHQILSPQPQPIHLIMPHIIKNCSCFDCCDCGVFSPHCCICDGLQAACRAGCAAVKAVLDLAAGAHLGRIDFKDVAAQAIIDPTPLTADIDDSFSTASIKANIKVRGIIEGKADVSLEPLVSIFTACFTLKPIDIPPTPIEISTSSPTFENKLEPLSTDDGISLQLSLKKTTLNLAFNVNPLLRIIANNPDLFVTCPLPAGVGAIIGATNQLFNQVFNLDRSIDLEPHSFPPARIGQLSIDMPGRPNKTKLGPRVNPLALGVVEVKTN
jgi:hypothetical protein